MGRSFFWRVFCTGLLFSMGASLAAQVVVYEDFVPERQQLYLKERFFYAQLHTGGGTLGYEQGRVGRRFRYSGWNVEFATQINPRAKAVNWYGSGRNYKYGMLNSFCMLRGGYGGLWVLNEKPYWGGVRVSIAYRGGFSLGLAFPQYVYVLYDDQGQDIRLEKLSADNPRHLDVAYVLARGPMLKGFNGLCPYPGAFLKAGMDFEFGKTQERSHTLGFGAMYDCYFTRIPLMIGQKSPVGFFNFYIEYKFGMRYGVR